MLITFCNSTGGPYWKCDENWLSDAPAGEWPGVKTDDSDRVLGMYLNVSRLSGEIPTDLGRLSSLELLRLGENKLRGEIPQELGNLANISVLDLRGNELGGRVPVSLEGYLDIACIGDISVSC